MRVFPSLLFAVSIGLVSASCFDFEDPEPIPLGEGGSPGSGQGGSSGSGSSGEGGAGSGNGGAGSGNGGAGAGDGGAGAGDGGAGAGDGGAGAGNGGAGGAAGTGGTVPNIPTDGLALWFSAELGVTAVGGAVERWENQASLGTDAFQNLPGLRPRRVQSTEPHPMLEFDGMGQHLVLGSGFDNFEAGLSFFVVTRSAEEQSCPGLLYLGNVAPVDDITISNDHALGTRYRVASSEFYDEIGFGVDETTLVGVVHSPNESISICLNGQCSPPDNGVLPSTTFRRQNFIGHTLETEPNDCDLHFHGRVGELLLYTRAVDTVERRQIEDYLQNKWRCCGSTTQ